MMKCFARAVETGSFSAAGRDLDVGQSNVSRYMAALERDLGIRLMQRSTRKLTLTPEGERYYLGVRAILDAVDEAESSARGEYEPAGSLRVACPTALARIYLLPLVGPFLARHPKLEFDFQFSDQYMDPINETVDLTFQIGNLGDNTSHARCVGMFRWVCAASVDYLARRGAPTEPSALREHDCIAHKFLSPSPWQFRDGEVAVTGRVRVNSPDLVAEAVLQGLGIGHGPIWLFEQALRCGSVRLVLSDYVAPPVPLQIVHAASRPMTRRSAVFIDFVADGFSKISAFEIG